MHHPRYGLTHHPSISSNITNTTHFSKPPMRPTLAHLPLQPHSALPSSPTLVTTHASTSPTLACHPRQHATNANITPTLANLPRKHTTCKSHILTNSMPFLKPLGIQLALKFQEKIQQFLLLVIVYTTAFIFQTFLSIFIKVWKTDTEKLNFFQRKLVCIIQKTAIFSKTNAQYFKKETVFKCQCRFDHFIYFKFAKIVY